MGTTGIVYRATDTRSQRDVAVKVLQADLVADPVIRLQVTRQARLLARIDHPNVVRVLDVLDDGQRVVLVLDYVSGGDLSDKVQLGGLPEWQVVPLMLGVLAGLGRLHHAGLVHRALHLGNILLSRDGVPKVTELGVAPGMSANRCPEPLQGLAFDARCDIRAVGVMLYELLTGEKPHDATKASDIKRLQGKATPALVAAIGKALAASPAQRFDSAWDMLDALGWSETHRLKQPSTLASQVRAPLRVVSQPRPVTGPLRALVSRLFRVIASHWKYLAVLAVSITVTVWLVWCQVWPFSIFSR